MQVPTNAGKRIKRLRADLGMLAEDFAQALKVTTGTVSRWENGHGQPSRLAWTAIERLATKHGVKL